jgi:hypothetical protein
MKTFNNLPDLFTFFNGEKVLTKADWEKRRLELIEWFSHNVYGEYDEEASKGFSFEVISDITDERCRKKTIKISKNGWESEFWLWLPLGKVKPAVIVHAILQFYEKDGEKKFVLGNVDGYNKTPSVSTLPIGYLLDRGYAVCAYYVSRAALDTVGGEDTNMNAMLIGKSKTATSARAIAAWSFFAKRIADYLISDSDVDGSRLAMTGHSRGGKTALYTAATDERYSFAFVSNSGCTGAAIARDNTGERIKDINDRFPHWFTELYKGYNEREDELPVDFHQLIACIAPRRVLVSSSSEDAWACPENEFASAVLASAVWEKFYSLKGLVAPPEPKLDEAYQGGCVAYHIKTGKHSFDFSDWIKCADYLDKMGWNNRERR